MFNILHFSTRSVRGAVPIWVAIELAVAHAAGIAATFAGKHHLAVTIYAAGWLALAVSWIAFELGQLTDTRERRLWRLSWLCVVLLLIGATYVAAGMWLGLYPSDAPYEVLLPISGALIVLTFGAAAAAPKSRAAYYSCIALLLLVGLIAAYCAYAVVELMIEVPQLWAAHFASPALIHVFNAFIAMGVTVYSVISLLGLGLQVLHRTAGDNQQIGEKRG
jgi:hypothetical protein